jgi:hypothetical protein
VTSSNVCSDGTLVRPAYRRPHPTCDGAEIGEFVLPDADHRPTRSGQGIIDAAIPLDVACQLREPVSGVRPGRTGVLGASMPPATKAFPTGHPGDDAAAILLHGTAARLPQECGVRSATSAWGSAPWTGWRVALQRLDRDAVRSRNVRAHVESRGLGADRGRPQCSSLW